MNKNIALIAFALSFPQAAAAQEVVLKIAHFLPAGAPAQQKVFQPWCDTLKADSGGRITCQFYPAMQLGGTPAQLVDQVRNGVADVVWTAPGYSTGRFPRIEAFELPFVVADAASGSRAVWQYYKAHAEAEFAAFKVLAFHVDGGQAIHTAGRGVAKVEDWKGLKLRASTRLGAKTVMALGGAPVAMPPSQLTEAISKGVVDGAMGSWELVVPLKLDEVTRYHAQPRKGEPYPSATVLMVLMNKDKYEKLPADLKAIIDRTTGLPMTETLGAVFDAENAHAHEVVAASGGTVTDFSPEFAAAMKEASAPVEAEWLKTLADRGIDGKPLAQAARELATTK
ncbi:TRAP transporter substrate-binding protein [Xanthobacter oligotrophicus]|uniref:TRAP transporter substrate-binding protein n=1 Tax=Xanthobacter oligotrophicus TaxID=2607286 RepID=UPI0011F12C6A|nr:TRAP transporter substrate-binding protein [Xanthobacter oligotrophicus]MCG5237895.1 TRAP transporter substrate-binding protein [Xanthobacter oligotrophicus]